MQILQDPGILSYAAFTAGCSGILGNLALLADIFITPETSFRTNTNSKLLVWIGDVATMNLVSLTWTFTGMDRMRYLTAYLGNLEKIKMELKIYQVKPQSEKKVALIVVISMITSMLLICIDFGLFFYEVIEEKGKVFTSSLYIFYNMGLIVVHGIIIHFYVIAMIVLWTVKNFNEILMSLLQEILKLHSPQNKLVIKVNNVMHVRGGFPLRMVNSINDSMALQEDVIKVEATSIPSALRHLAYVYCSICDVVRQVDESHSVVMVVLFVLSLVSLVITPYHIIRDIFNYEKSDHSDPLIQFCWAAFHLSNLALIIEPCHRTHVQMDFTKILISQMTRFAPPEFVAEQLSLAAELDLFYKHLKLNKVSYSPMKMFTLNRSLVVAILGSITTYLVVIVQL